MLTGEEGIGKVSVYTELVIKQVFNDFYNLAKYSLSPKIFKVKNENFKKLVEHEIENRDNKSVDLINKTNLLLIEIIDLVNKYDDLNKNQLKECMRSYHQNYNKFFDDIAFKMFKYGVQLGLELKKEETKKSLKNGELFKW